MPLGMALHNEEFRANRKRARRCKRYETLRDFPAGNSRATVKAIHKVNRPIRSVNRPALLVSR